MALTNVEIQTLLDSITGCSTCGQSSGCGCKSSCGVENPCKYGTVIGNINIGSYLKLKDLGTIDCKKTVELSGWKIKSDTITVTPDTVNGIWQIEKPCCPDKDEKVKLDIDDCAGYLSEKIGVCSNGYITLTPKNKPGQPGCKYLEICFDETKIPKPDGKIKVSSECELKYISEVLTGDNDTTSINWNNCKGVIKVKRVLRPSVRLAISSPSEFYRTSEVNDTGSIPNTGGQVINTDNDKGFYGIDIDTEVLNTDLPSTYMNTSSQPISRLSATPTVRGINILKDGIYKFTGSAQNRINNGISSYRTFIGRDRTGALPTNAILDDCKSDPSIPRTAINQIAVFTNYDLHSIAPHTDKLPGVEIDCLAGDFIFLGGRISTDVASGPGVGEKGWLKVDFQAFGYNASDVQGTGLGPVTWLQAEYISDMNGVAPYEI